MISTSGAAFVLAIYQPRLASKVCVKWWSIEEIEYFGDTRGEHEQMHFIDHNKRKVPVLIKALNSRAREMTKVQAQASTAAAKASASSKWANTDRAQAQKALFSTAKRPERPEHGQTPPAKQPKGNES